MNTKYILEGTSQFLYFGNDTLILVMDRHFTGPLSVNVGCKLIHLTHYYLWQWESLLENKKLPYLNHSFPSYQIRLWWGVSSDRVNWHCQYKWINLRRSLGVKNGRNLLIVTCTYMRGMRVMLILGFYITWFYKTVVFFWKSINAAFLKCTCV